MTPRRLLAFCKFRKPSPEYQTAFDKFPGIEFNASGDSLPRMKCEEWERPLTAQNTHSGSRGFLRRAAVWLSNCRVRFTRNRDGRHDNFHKTTVRKPG